MNLAYRYSWVEEKPKVSIYDATVVQCSGMSDSGRMESIEADLRATVETLARAMTVLHSKKLLADEDVLEILQAFERHPDG